ncbi:unnamed protein product [Heterobilharzia americana]|nr:unnamed protein product [Heterobilharzia americana]
MGISLVSYCNFSSTATEYQMQPNEIFRIAQFFCTQLLCCRHRGAFELCATGFTNFCIALVKHPGYYEIPVHWLNTITGQVLLSETSSKGSIIVQGIDFSLDACMGEHDTVECVTRRGAGCPLFVQAILGAELTRDLNGLTTLTNTVNWLLKSITSSISKIVNLQQSGYEATCVLNLNIIRGIFQSTNLNYHTNRYLQKGLIIALDGLGCGHLSIRNASMLFYSTIIQRIFGVTRSKEIKSRKNCLSTSTFFKLYPKFQQYLIETLTWYSGNPKILDTNRFKLYSILYLVTHLLPPPQVANVDEMLYKLLIRCGCDSGIRVRKIASLALTSIMHPNCIMKTLDHLLCLIDEWIVGGNSIKEWFITGRSNVLHSLLLQVYALLYSSMDVHSAPAYIAPNVCISSTDYASIIDRLKTSFSWLNDPKHVTCSVSRQLYMKILGHEYDHQPVTIKYGSYGLEREYAEACINTIVDREVRKLGDNTSAYIELIQLTKSLDSIELFTSFLRRIYLHIHAKLAHPVDWRYYYNVELFDMTRRIFTFDSLFQVLFDFNRRYAHDSDGDDCILLLLNSINDESYHYIFELLAILIHSDNVSTDSVNRAIHWTSNQLKSIIKMIKVKAVNHFPFRNYFSFTSFIHFHINLIYVFAEKNVEQEHKQQQVVSTYYSQQHNHCYLNHIVELCELCRVCFDVFDDDDSTNACFEVKYAILHSLFLLDISVLNTIILNNENVEKVLQAFDVLIENITNPESSKLQKLACEITQNLLISSHPEYKCVLQLPYVLLPQLVSLLMQYNSEVIFKHMLRFVWEQMSSLTISRTQDPDGDNDDQGNTSDHAFPQTTFNPGCDTLESIKIMCNTLSSWLSVNSDSSSHPNKHILSIGGVCEDNEVLHGGNTFEEFESLLIRKPDFLASLYLNRYISSFRLTC